MTNRARAAIAFVLFTACVAGCPAGRKDNQLGGECYSTNDCPQGTTGLTCNSSCVGPSCPEKSFCTKACTADTDCVSKVGAMVCTAGKCAFAKK